MDTPLVKRAYNLGLKAVPNFTQLTEAQITFYEQHLDQIPAALSRGFAIPAVELDFLVHVDRSVKPSYPVWMEKLEYPELECSGPTEYNLQDGVEQWLHDKQESCSVLGNIIHAHLKKDNAIASCLNLQDGLAIQEKGIAVFRKLYAGKAVFLWRSLVWSQLGRLGVPYLVEGSDTIMLSWFWLDRELACNDPALRFKKVA